MPKDYAAEYVPSPLDDYPALGWRIVPDSFGPRGAIRTWNLVVVETGEVIDWSTVKFSLSSFAKGVEWQRERDAARGVEATLQRIDLIAADASAKVFGPNEQGGGSGGYWSAFRDGLLRARRVVEGKG